MKVFDKFFQQYAYKFDKGYPDMNNAQDVLLLESLLSEVLGEEFNIINEATDAEEGIEILKNELGLLDSDFRKMSNVEYKVLIDGPNSDRVDLIKKMDALNNFVYDPNNRASSLGAVLYNKIRFVVKPRSKQGRQSAGMGNEDAFITQITPYFEDGPKNVIFKSPSKSLIQNNVEEVIASGYDTKDTKKADVILKGSKLYPISLKKNNAGFWESADTRYKDVVKRLSEKIKNKEFGDELVFKPFTNKLGIEKKGINTMYNENTGKKVTGVIVTDLPDAQSENIIFGSDDAKVIYQSFDTTNPEQIYELDGNNLTVKVTKIVENMKDVENLKIQPILNIRHDSDRTSTGGLRATVVPYNLVYKNGGLTGDKIELSYNEIMK
tara:strand:+ start:13 stop:1152 length:1140 start_codon:yes stop_codon:yes gene_type:complete